MGEVCMWYVKAGCGVLHSLAMASSPVSTSDLGSCLAVGCRSLRRRWLVWLVPAKGRIAAGPQDRTVQQ